MKKSLILFIILVLLIIIAVFSEAQVEYNNFETRIAQHGGLIK